MLGIVRQGALMRCVRQGLRRNALLVLVLCVGVLLSGCGAQIAPGSDIVTDADYAACLDKIRNQALPAATYIYDRNGALLTTITDPDEGLRIVLTSDDIPLIVRQATVAAEDRFFYTHPGYDMRAITRAFMQNQQAGEVVSGASTITQQLIKSVCLTPEQTYERKLREINLAARLTEQFSRDSILTFYLNKVYYGSQAYGIEAAANVFFGKSAMDLTLAEAAVLTGLTASPFAGQSLLQHRSGEGPTAVCAGTDGGGRLHYTSRDGGSTRTATGVQTTAANPGSDRGWRRRRGRRKRSGRHGTGAALRAIRTRSTCGALWG